MDSQPKSSNTFLELSTPPSPQSDSLPIDSSLFAAEDHAMYELIEAMKSKTNELETSAAVQPPPVTSKGPKIVCPTFRGKPLAMALYQQQKRKRVARQPPQPEPKKRKPRKTPSVMPTRDKRGKFSHQSSTTPAQPTEASSTDTTRTPVSSEQVPAVVTEPISPPAAEQVTETSNSTQAVASPTTQVVFMDVSTAFYNGLLFPNPSPNELASFIWSNYIIAKLTDNQSLYFCREQFFHQFYQNQLVSFFQATLGTTPVSYSQLDNLIITAIHLFGFN